MMKRTIFLGLAFCALSAFAQTNLSSGIDLKNLDTSIKPGNDFYHYAAGGWLKSHPLDAEHAENGAFVDLQELNQKRIQGIILEYASKPQQKGSLGQKIGSLYNLMMDSARLNREGWTPIKPTLDKIAAIKNRKEYQLVCAQLDRNGEGTMMFGIGVGADQKDAEWNLVGIGQGGLGLGERDYYVSDDAQNKRVLEAYKQYLKKLFMLTGADEATAEKKMEAVLAIETRIAKVSYDQVKLRDIDANYHKMSYNQLVYDFSGIDWGNVFLASGFPAFDFIDVGQPEPIHEVEKILADTPLDDLKTYAEAKVIAGATGQLSDEFRKTAFALSQVLTGVKPTLETRREPRERHPRGGHRQALCRQVFPRLEQAAHAGARAQPPDSTRTAYQRGLLDECSHESPGQGQARQLHHQDRLSRQMERLQRPAGQRHDKWKDYSGLQVNDSLSLYENLQKIARWATDDEIAKHVNKKVDKTEWGMTPQTINAYYNPTTNEICFPAAILQPPFFDPKADDAANYGAIGGVIGHEMSHGFDDQGAQFDKYGNQHNWWTAQDKNNFDARTKVLADWFSSFEVLPGVKVNGKQTLGENIGDNGGLNIAFRALQNSLKTTPLPVKDGFTPEQRFFLAWGRVWASNMTDELVKYLLTVDVHSPNYARVNGALPMIDAWYTAFNVKKGDKMFVPKNKRAHIW